MAIIKCAKCRNLLEVSDLHYTSQDIPYDLTRIELVKFGEQNKVRFDCPKCDKPVALYNCEILEDNVVPNLRNTNKKRTAEHLFS